jgi:hypothetical protein
MEDGWQWVRGGPAELGRDLEGSLVTGDGSI